ncbi:hypothetical protein Q0L73_14130, partial [Staphylococcus aureus]|nr:hypothetical protein [Staphylococcus aureus]
ENRTTISTKGLPLFFSVKFRLLRGLVSFTSVKLNSLIFAFVVAAALAVAAFGEILLFSEAIVLSLEQDVHRKGKARNTNKL